MLRSVVKLCEETLGATDGDIGHVNDFYFDAQNWAVRYLVANTDPWMPGRMVLLSPHAFKDLYQGGRVLQVNLTRHQIENSPSIESQKPVSRQYEEEYHRYYGWAFYWQREHMRGMSDMPVGPSSPGHFPKEQSTTQGGEGEYGNTHLHSAKKTVGYHIQAADEVIGQLTDFVMDDKNWAFHRMVIDTNYRSPAKRVMISPSQVNRISWDESKVYVDLTKDAILESPVYDQASFSILENGLRISP